MGGGGGGGEGKSERVREKGGRRGGGEDWRLLRRFVEGARRDTERDWDEYGFYCIMRVTVSMYADNSNPPAVLAALSLIVLCAAVLGYSPRVTSLFLGKIACPLALPPSLSLSSRSPSPLSYLNSRQ